jgi:Right handed beta helix region
MKTISIYTWSKRILFPLVVAAISLFLLFSPQITMARSATTFYVDSVGGSDSNNGTSASTPWKNLTKVDQQTFQAGDHLLLKAGSKWAGQQLTPKGSGVSGNPIYIDMYGSGNKPFIAEGGANHSAVYFFNQQYWDVSNLEVTNTASSLGDYQGVYVLGQDAGVLNHFYFHSLNIHNVTGEVKWIKDVGIDAAKKTGGIVFQVQTTKSVKTKFNDILIENSTFTNNSFGSIIIKQASNWWSRSSSTDTNWYPNTNITIRNNYLNHTSDPNACDTIFLAGAQNALIDSNVSVGAGTSGIEMEYGDHLTVQHNEISGVVVKAGGGDSNAIDPDLGTTNITVQYNYIHDNNTGMLLYGANFGMNYVIRYNIFQNNKNRVLDIGNKKGPVYFYNNTIYNKTTKPVLVYFRNYDNLTGSWYLNNNIFYSAQSGATLDLFAGMGYAYNAYYGTSVPKGTGGDNHAVTSGPGLVNPGTGGSGIGTLSGYKLQSNSPLKNAGTPISNNGGKDFFGTALPAGKPSIGAAQ